MAATNPRQQTLSTIIRTAHSKPTWAPWSRASIVPGARHELPISRHRSGASNEYGFENLGTVKDTALIVRAIATIGNHDYVFDYPFHMDASLEIIVRASGYLQSFFY
ncbi:hypothetical protein K504DRAFT_452291 [Pleomassaria siparia CBS 279.74]|uniref:Copper amine oxidase catalytic domain-containing protein n=1 Tax=Pleomassaria siparia CBS 279.74 TaxID=1314801 RepID=A0A6G1KHT5_9PLEO|nr:hypothetical protein K504DRAFT_452291 [Pleomassaria siparia CBS 279.74]